MQVEAVSSEILGFDRSRVLPRSRLWRGSPSTYARNRTAETTQASERSNVRVLAWAKPFLETHSAGKNTEHRGMLFMCESLGSLAGDLTRMETPRNLIRKGYWRAKPVATGLGWPLFLPVDTLVLYVFVWWGEVHHFNERRPDQDQNYQDRPRFPQECARRASAPPGNATQSMPRSMNLRFCEFGSSLDQRVHRPSGAGTSTCKSHRSAQRTHCKAKHCATYERIERQRTESQKGI